MQALVNGLDTVSYKQLRNLTACSGDSSLLSTWMHDVNSTNLRMLAVANGMDAVNYKQFRTLSVHFVDQIMLSNGMYAVNSLLWIHNFVE